MTHTNGPERLLERFTSVVFVAALFISIGPAVPIAAAQTHTFVTDTANNRVVVFNTADNSPVKPSAVGTAPSQIALSADGAKAFVANSGAPFSISIVDASDQCITGGICADAITVPVAAAPLSIAVGPTRAFVLIDGGALQIVDLATNQAGDPITVGGTGGGVAVTPDESYLYVASGNVTIFQISSNGLAVVNSFPPEKVSDPDVYNFAVSVAIARDSTVYESYNTYYI